jgi:hypothetical protein
MMIIEFVITDWRGGWCCCIDLLAFYAKFFHYTNAFVSYLFLCVCEQFFWKIHIPLADFWSRSRTILGKYFWSSSIVFNGQTSLFAPEVLYLPHLSPVQGADEVNNCFRFCQFSLIVNLSGGPREVGSEIYLRELMHSHGWVVSCDYAGALDALTVYNVSYVFLQFSALSQPLSSPDPAGDRRGMEYRHECHTTYGLKPRLAIIYFHTEVLRKIYNIKWLFILFVPFH